jgi:hypothetical protein
VVVTHLASCLITLCDPAWDDMKNDEIGRAKQVQDQSGYVNILIGELVGPAFTKLRRLISLAERHRWVCEAFASLFNEKFEAAVHKCRPIGSIGAEQLLVDLQAIRPVLSALDPSQAYRDLVDKLISNIERTYKILLHDAVDPESFVAHYYLMTDGDGREEGFRKILDLKGIGKGVTYSTLSAVAGTNAVKERYLEAFRRHQPPPPSNDPKKATLGSLKSKLAHFFN